MNLRSLVLAAFFAAAGITPLCAQNSGQLGSGQLWGNATASQGPAAPTNLSALIDRAIGSTSAAFLQRGSSGWAANLLSGDGTLSNAGALTLATVNSNVGSFGSATQCPNFTVNAKGLITAAGQTGCTASVTITAGSTATSGITSGDIIGSSSNLVVDTAIAYANVVTLAGTQSLTNKTITSSTNSLGGVTAAFGSDAKGDIYQNGGSSNVLTRLGIGAAGTVLQPSSGLLAYTASPSVTGAMSIFSGTAPPSGGSASDGYFFSSTSAFGVFFGTSTPTFSAAEGSLFLTTSGAPYYNNNGTTGWTQLGTGGGGSPGGSNTQVQYNNSSSFGGISGVTSNGTAMTFANGDLILTNATSGQVTLQPVTGALGTVVASVPANTGMIAELNLAQAWSANQTYGSGNLQMNGATGFTHSDSTNGQIVDVIRNANSGSSATTLVRIGNDATADLLDITGNSSVNTGNNGASSITLSAANGLWIQGTTGVNGLEASVLGSISVVTAQFLASASGAVLDNFSVPAETNTITGTTGITALSVSHLYQQTITDSSSATATTASTLTIDNAPTCSGSLTCTNKYALNIPSGANNIGGATTLGGALTYGGVTLSNAVTGTGNMVLSASPTFTGTITAAAETLSGNLTTNITGGGTQCVQASNTGVLSGTGSGCGGGGVTTTAPTVQRFTSGSGTYTTPASVKWIEIVGCGSGGGGGGVGGSTAPAGNNGNVTTFGTSLITASAGTGGLGDNVGDGVSGVAGSANTINAGPLVVVNAPGNGSDGGIASQNSIPANVETSGSGAPGLGGAAPGKNGSGNGSNAGTNSCSGGAGAVSASGYAAGGGSSGGYVDVIIDAPSATYSYAVGAAATGGVGTGAGAQTGGTSGAGVITVVEHYNY